VPSGAEDEHESVVDGAKFAHVEVSGRSAKAHSSAWTMTA
jgi:hypothetical protein